jgi:transaldolase
MATVEQVVALAGCDLLTISPELLEKLDAAPGAVEPCLTVRRAKQSSFERLSLTEPAFRWMHNEDAMATDKLSEGIRTFNADAKKLETFARERAAS